MASSSKTIGLNSSANGLVIGCLEIGGTKGSYVKGYIDEVRVSNSAKYSSLFIPADAQSDSESNTMALYHFSTSNELIDTSSADSTADNLTANNFSPAPTLARISSFKAVQKKKRVILKWETDSEDDNAGFYVLKRNGKKGGFIRIDESFIPAKGNDAVGGESYSFADENVKRGHTYYYRIEDVDISGKSTKHNNSVKVRIKKSFRHKKLKNHH